MRYNITYRAQRRKAARKARQELGYDGPLSEYWTTWGDRYFAGKGYLDGRFEKKLAASKSYASNGAREVARRVRRNNKENEQ